MHTFLAVTFAWSFAFALVWLRWLFRCKHAWALLVDRDFEPAAKVVKDLGYGWGTDARIPCEWWTRTYFSIVKCDKCGAIKKFKVVVKVDR